MINLTLSRKYFKKIKAFIYGKNSFFFKRQLKNKIRFENFNNLKNAFKKIIILTKKEKLTHKTILFSPCAASFDSFKNFEDRGSYFNKLVKDILMEDKNFLYNFYYEWWKNIDKFIFSLIILLFITGLFFSLVSTSLIVSDKLDTNDYLFFFKHLIFIILGIIIIFFFFFKSRKTF